MNKVIYTLSVIAIFFAGNVYGTDNIKSQAVETIRQKIDYRVVFLQNKYLKLKFIPEVMGRLTQIEYLPDSCKLLMPFAGMKVAYDPIFSRVESNGMGFRDLFWGARGLTGAMNSMKTVVNRSKGEISFFSNNYGPLPISLHRTVKLPENSTIFEITSKVLKHDSGKNLKLAPWYNLVPGGPETGVLTIPARGGVRNLNATACHYCTEDTLLTGSKDINFVAPARNWVATCYPKAKLVFAIIVPQNLLESDGLFYFWSGKIEGRNVRTMEIILRQKTLKAGSSYTYSCRLGVFPGLSSVKEICNNTAIDCRVRELRNYWEIELDLCPGQELSAGRMKIELRPTKGQGAVITVGEVDLKNLPATKVKSLKLRLLKEVVPSGRYRISGTLHNNRFELLQPTLTKKGM
jgi:hypothetical protein